MYGYNVLVLELCLCGRHSNDVISVLQNWKMRSSSVQGVRGSPNENGERQYGVQALGYPHSRLSWRAPVRSIQPQGYPCSQAPLVSTSMEHKLWASLIPGSTGEHQCDVCNPRASLVPRLHWLAPVRSSTTGLALFSGYPDEHQYGVQTFG